MVKQDFIAETEANLQAQCAVVGAMLIDSDIIGDVLSKSSEIDFTGENKTIYTAIKSLFMRGETVDPVMVQGLVGEKYDRYLVKLMQITPTAANYKAYLEALKNQTLCRQARKIGEELSECIDAEDARQLIDTASKLLTSGDGGGWKAYTMEDLLHRFFDKYDKKPEYLDWGIDKLNSRVSVEPGDFVVIGGRPSVGKTAFAIEVATSVCKKKRVGFFSFETGPNKFIDRAVSKEFRIDLRKIKNRELSFNELKRISDCADEFCRQQITFIPANGMTPADIQSYALAKKFDVIVVDYLQIVNSGLSRALSTEQVRAISIGLHNLSQRNEITVISLAQLKRAASKQDADLPPTLSDLKESGQIEQDADVIMFLYRKEAGVRNSPRKLKVAKNKDGPCGTIDLIFEGKYQTFTADGCSVDDEFDDDEISEVDESTQETMAEYPQDDDDDDRDRRRRSKPWEDPFRGNRR